MAGRPLLVDRVDGRQPLIIRIPREIEGGVQILKILLDWARYVESCAQQRQIVGAGGQLLMPLHM